MAARFGLSASFRLTTIQRPFAKQAFPAAIIASQGERSAESRSFRDGLKGDECAPKLAPMSTRITPLGILFGLLAMAALAGTRGGRTNPLTIPIGCVLVVGVLLYALFHH
jgi:hypothetical protein